MLFYVVLNGKLEANIMKFEILCMDNKEFVKSLKLYRLILVFKQMIPFGVKR